MQVYSLSGPWGGRSPVSGAPLAKLLLTLSVALWIAHMSLIPSLKNNLGNILMSLSSIPQGCSQGVLWSVHFESPTIRVLTAAVLGFVASRILRAVTR